MAISIAFLVLLFISPAVYAVDHTVGGNSGWTTGFNYDTWATAQTFTVGDTLVFNYGGTHAVDEVTQPNYQSCSSANSISDDDDSPTTITLPAPGTRYFICPRSNHCNQGMRLTVTVVAANGTTPSTPPTPPGTPAPPTSPSGTPATPTSPPPPSGGAISILDGRKGLMVVGSSLVLAALFGVMG